MYCSGSWIGGLGRGRKSWKVAFFCGGGGAGQWHFEQKMLDNCFWMEMIDSDPQAMGLKGSSWKRQVSGLWTVNPE